MFIGDFNNTTFNYAITMKDEFSQFLQQFFIDFRELIKTLNVVEHRGLGSDNAGEFNSAKCNSFVGKRLSSASFLIPDNSSKW